ncbi:MAG: hypothetical protein V1757_09340 [Actinomycetota bacterium]
MMSSSPAAVAADDEAPLTAEDVLPGTCSPSMVIWGQVTDCRFPLARIGTLDPWLGPHVADEDVSYDDENDSQADCAVEGSSLVCRSVFAFYEPGERVVRPRISGEFSSATATFTTVDGSDYPVNLSPDRGNEPYVFGYNPLRVWKYGTASAESGLARVWLRDDPSVSWTVNVPAAPSDGMDPVEIDVGGLAPGRYRMTPCIGDTPEACEEVPGGITFQVGTGRLEELIPGWNRPHADRINVVFAASGQVTLDDARATARDLVAWDGPLLVSEEDTLLESDVAPSAVWSLEFGPFAIEPFRSARDRFNLWFLDDLVADPQALEFSALPLGLGVPLPDFGLADVQVTRLHFQAPGRFGRSEAGWSSFTSPDGPTTVARDGLEFAGTYVALPAGYTRMQADIVAHEWGHALFDLRDEYQEPSRGVGHGYPNCAPDEAAAEQWWGDEMGAIDPFVYEYIDVNRQWSQWVDSDLVARITIGAYPGGCYSDQDEDAVRPTQDSIMNSGVPVFGAVNRARAEGILALWSGRAPLTADAVTVSCDPVRSSGPSAVCGLAVLSYVDVPPRGVLVTAEATSARCPAVSGGETDGTMLACDPLALSGAGPWDVTFTTASGARVGEVVLDAPPPPPPEPPVLPPVIPEPVPPGSHAGAWLVIGALVLVILGSAGVLVRRRSAWRQAAGTG